MPPLLLLLAAAGLLLVMLTLILRRYFAGCNAEPARRRRLTLARGTTDGSDIAPLGVFASDEDDAACDARESDNQDDVGGGGTDVAGGDMGCGTAGSDFLASDAVSLDAGCADAGGGGNSE